MGSTTTTPTVIIGTPPVSGGGVTATGGVLSIGGDWTQLIASASDMFQANGRRVIGLQAGDLSMAFQGQVGRQIDGITVTQSMVDRNQQLINQLAAFCRRNNIGVVIYADTDLAPSANWTHQWLGPAVIAGLPIVAVSNVNEPDWLYQPSAFPQIAQYMVAIVSQITNYYPNVTIGQWVGGSAVSVDAQFWSAYNSMAASAHLPLISYVEADCYGNTPWFQPLAQTNALYATLASAVQMAGMTLYAAIRGTVENLSGQAWTAQTEYQVAVLAPLLGDKLSAIDINSWENGEPYTVAPVNDAGSESNAAAMIQAIYSQYRNGQISASSGSIGLGASQAFLTVNAYTSVDNVSINLSAGDVADQTRVAIVITDRTGFLRATAVGGASVTGIGTTTLVLDGTSADINAELKTLKIFEPVTGPDAIDIEAFGVNGRISDAQVFAVAEQGNTLNTIQTASFSPALVNGVLMQPWTSAVVTSNGTMMVSEVLTWHTTTMDPAGIAQVVKLDSAHLPSAEVGISFGSNPISTPSSHWNPSPFTPTALTSQLAVQTTTLTFASITGVLLSSDDAFLPLASMTGGDSPKGLANGGHQIIYMNTAGNPGWNPAWGTQFSTAMLTYGSYDDHQQLLEQVLLGNESNSFITVDNIFDPATGRIWEQFVTTRPPTNATDNLSTFPSGLMYVTEFNTGDNPNWDGADWKTYSQITMNFQDFYTIGVGLQPPPPMITAINHCTAADSTLFYSPSVQGAFTLSGFGGAGDSIAISINGSAVGTTIVASNGLWGYSLPPIGQPGTYKLTAIQTVAQADGITAASANTTVLIMIGSSFAGVAADISAHFDSLQNLAVAGQLGSITVTDWGSSALSLTASQMGTDRLALGKIAGPVNLVVTGVTASNAKNLIGLTHYDSVLVSDTMANVVANMGILATLAASGGLASISLTDTATPVVALSSAQLAADCAVLTAVTSPYLLTITDSNPGPIAGIVTSTALKPGGNFNVALTGATGTVGPSCDLVFEANGLLSQEWDPRLGGGYVLTAYDITGTHQWSSFVQTVNGSNLLLSIDYTMHVGQPYSRIVDIFGGNNSQPTSEIDYYWTSGSQARYTATGSQTWVQGISAASAASAASQPLVVSVAVSDTATNVVAALTTLQGLPLAKLRSITLTDSGTPALTLTEAQYNAAAGVLGKIASPYTLALTGVTAAGAARAAAQPQVVSVSVSDTATNVEATLTTLQGLASGKLGSITLTDSGIPTLTLTAAQYNSARAVLVNIIGSYNVMVGSVLPNIAPSLREAVIADVVGQAYTSNITYYDPAGNVTRMVFNGVTGTGYSSYEYDFTGGVFAGSKFFITTPPAGASYASYELDYDANSIRTAERFFVPNVSGQSYTVGEYDFNGEEQLSRIMLNGFSNSPFVSLELNYDAGAYIGFKVFYSGQPGQFSNVEEDVTSGNLVTKVIYSGSTDTPYSSVEQDYSAGAISGTVYNFTNVNVSAAGYSANAYHVMENAADEVTQEVFDLTNGGHLIYAFANMQFLNSEGSDTFIGQTFGNCTFVLNPVYGQATFADFGSHLSGTTHDTIQFSALEFPNFNVMYSATADTARGARIVASNGDTVTLVGVTKAQILANPGDFRFA